MEFYKSFSSTGGIGVTTTLFPPVFTKSCPVKEPEDYTHKNRGINLAMWVIWDNFYKSRRNCSREYRDVLVLFEDDAFATTPDANRIAMDYVRNISTDILYLGYCFRRIARHPLESGNAPVCFHSYVMTVDGVKKLLDNVDMCSSTASDQQVSELADKGVVSWELVKHKVNESYLRNQFRTHGMYLSGHFRFDGLYVQAKYDRIPSYPNGTCVSHLHNKHLHLLVNNTWRLIHNMKVYETLGIQEKKIQPVSEWQFRQYPVGDNIREDEMDAVANYLRTISGVNTNNISFVKV
jgi:hypothetical protein